MTRSGKREREREKERERERDLGSIDKLQKQARMNYRSPLLINRIFLKFHNLKV